MTMEEKQAIIEKNLKNDPALKAEYQALAADLASPEEAAKKLESDPELSARYAAIMAKVANGVELEDDELGYVSGGMAPWSVVQARDTAFTLRMGTTQP